MKWFQLLAFLLLPHFTHAALKKGGAQANVSYSVDSKITLYSNNPKPKALHTYQSGNILVPTGSVRRGGVLYLYVKVPGDPARYLVDSDLFHQVASKASASQKRKTPAPVAQKKEPVISDPEPQRLVPDYPPEPVPQNLPVPSPAPVNLNHKTINDPSLQELINVVPALQGEEVFQACLRGEMDVDLKKLYRGQTDCQFNNGTCVGWSAGNVIEMAWWRHNLYTALQKGRGSWKGMPVPMSSQLLYLQTMSLHFELNKEDLMERVRYLPVNDYRVKLMDGVASDEFAHEFLTLFKSDPKRFLFYQDEGMDSTAAETHLNALNAKIADLIRRHEKETGKSRHDDDFFTTPFKIVDSNNVVHEENILKTIISSIDNAVYNTANNLRHKINLAEDFDDTLTAYKVFETKRDDCDENKIKKIFLYFLCSGIPLQVSGFSSIFKGNHAIVSMGYKKKSNSFTIKNSHGGVNEEPIPLSSFCAIGGLNRALVYYMEMKDPSNLSADNAPLAIKAKGSALSNLEPQDTSDFYPFERLDPTPAPMLTNSEPEPEKPKGLIPSVLHSIFGL